MRKTIGCLFLYTLLIFSSIQPFYTAPTIHHVLADNVPQYAKWGRIAMQKTKEQYPHAEIVDYLHLGRESDTTTITEKFKLWLIESDKEFGVIINIKFDNKTEQIQEIEFIEVSN
ncbi:DUF3889 domain-containing protein [Bacillus sp. Marseille-P3661]|uniref:DUF3889 domain-containing protein n=1 Tax=Bacillus sp. Marseille-P3661 TaxID=1936234 RepID=UPI000C8307A6|nr:DUF3889 domain-containing protein [Bacillus sp. Marseille-P3661]